jgi:ferredoxin-thioredoxin reductase catalytic subunit
MTTIGTLIANLALADIRRKRRLIGLEYAREKCACGHRRDDHLCYDAECVAPTDYDEQDRPLGKCKCAEFVAEED